MKLRYYTDSDSPYIELKPGPGIETRAVCDGLKVDLVDAGNVVGFDFDGVTKHLDLTKLEVKARSVQHFTVL